jgi:hypothetical protein
MYLKGILKPFHVRLRHISAWFYPVTAKHRDRQDGKAIDISVNKTN